MKTGADFIFVGSGAVELTARKAGGIVRVWKGWCGARGCSNPSGSRPNFLGRQHLTFDKGGKGVGGFRGMVRFCEGWVRNEGLLTDVSEKRKGYGKCGNSSGSRPNFFGDSTSPLTRGGKNVVRSEGGLAIPTVLTAKSIAILETVR